MADGRAPRYREILDALRGEIAAGAHPVGGALPSEAALCARFEASRFTVREALRRLQGDGMVARVQGAGSRVLRDAPAGVFVQDYRSVPELTQYAEATRLTDVTIGEATLDAAIAPRIGGAAGQTWTFLRAMRRGAGRGAEPLAMLESYIPIRFADAVQGLAAAPGPIYAGLARIAGEPILSAEQETEALAAPYHVAEALGVAAGAPVLMMLRRYASASGMLIASFNWHRGGDRYVHRTRLALEG